MKKSTFWKLGTSCALLFGLSACSSTSSDDDNEIFESSNSVLSSSATWDISSSSRRGSGKYCDTLSTTLAAPTDLNVVKSGDEAKWVLMWEYEENSGRTEDGFIIQVLNMSDEVPSWDILDSTTTSVTMYNLVGSDKAGKHYRVVAKDACDESKPTALVEISGSGSTNANTELAIPTELKLDTLDDNKWQLSWSYTNNKERPENGFVLQSLDLSKDSPVWKDDGNTNKGVHVIVIDGNKKGGLLYHVAAKDTNGISDYSEQISIPRVSDGTETNPDSKLALAVPTELKLDSMGNNKWKLSWSYTDNTARPAKGFRIQRLDLTAKTPAWTDTSKTGEGVRYIIYDASKNNLGGQYIRVAAIDTVNKKEQRSLYSEEIMIPNVGGGASGAAAVAKMAVPTDLKVDSLGDNKWLVSWSYTNNDARPEKKGFKVEVLYPEAETLEWTKFKSLKTGVHSFVMTNTEKDFTTRMIRVAAIDADDSLSDYSDGLRLPTYTKITEGTDKDGNVLAVPTDLKLDSIGKNKWRLSWKYTNNSDRPANGFVIQKLDVSVSSPKWEDALSTAKGVKYIDIDNTTKKFSDQYLRVAAKDSMDISEYSSEVYVPEYIDYDAPASKPALAAPTSLKLDSIGENEYRLSWSYTNNKDHAEQGFRLQTLNINDKDPNWTFYKNVKTGVHAYKVDAKDYEGIFFRVAAIDGTDSSEYSNEVQIPKYIDYTKPSGTLAVPTSLKIDSIGENEYRLSWSYTRTTRPEDGFVIELLNLKGTKQWDSFPNAKPINAGVHFFEISATDVKTYGGQFVRVAATDGEDYSDYSTEIQIPKYVTYTLPELPVPYGLQLDTLGDDMYQLSWSYDDIAAHPEDGFILQTLDPLATSPIWKDRTESRYEIQKGVHLVIIDGHENELGGMLVRVVAKDANGTKSKYSSAMSIPSVAEAVKTDLNVPSNLAIEDLGMNKYKISWDYNDATDRPEDGFILEELDESASTPEWTRTHNLTTSKSVQFIVVKAGEKAISYRVAAKDEKGESGFSASIQVPAAWDNPPKKGCVGEFATPTGFKAERVAPSAWRLIWNYTRNTKCVEEGFVIQQLDVTGSKREWIDLDSTDVNVRYYNLEGIKNLNQYYRVAAKRGDHRTEFSSDVQITRLIAYSADVPFKAPEAKARIYQNFYAFNYYDYANNKVVANQFTKWPKECSAEEIEAEPENCKEKDIFEFQAVVNDSFPNHAIVYKNTVRLEYQFRWDGETDDMWHNVTVTDKDVSGISQGYSTTEIIIPYDLCKSYAQVRIIWEDAEAIDTTEWSKPVGPLYNSFEYLYIGDSEEEDCDELYNKESEDPEEVAAYKKCKAKPKPIDYTPCKTK